MPSRPHYVLTQGPGAVSQELGHWSARMDGCKDQPTAGLPLNACTPEGGGPRGHAKCPPLPSAESAAKQSHSCLGRCWAQGALGVPATATAASCSIELYPEPPRPAFLIQNLA